MFEYSGEEVIGYSSMELNLFIDFNERMKSTKILEKDGYIRDYELEMLTRTGKKLTLLVSSESIIISEQKHFLRHGKLLAQKWESSASSRTHPAARDFGRINNRGRYR
jgi:hypothetical protein